MRRLRGRSGRPRKSTEEIMAEFQEEWDELEYQDDSCEQGYGEEYENEVFESDPIEEYEGISPEDEQGIDDSVGERSEAEYEEDEYGPEYAERESEAEYEEDEYGPEYAEGESEAEYEEDEYGPEYAEEESEAEYEEDEYGPEYAEEESEAGYEDVEYAADYVEEAAGSMYGEPEEDPQQEYYGNEDDFGDEPAMSSRKRKEKEEKGDQILDKFILIAGVAVLLMALVTGFVLLRPRLTGTGAEPYQEVGAQLADVELIGGRGLDAVASAQQTYSAIQQASVTPEPQPTPVSQGYDEQEYKPDINVQMNFSSIEKDLKIKFVNRETGKLISNVPFSISITDPNGQTVMWSDDDMDGIIYKKSLTPGQYRLVINAFTDEKYKSYGLVTAEQKVEVKKEIEYKKVDVSDEVKTESQINVAKEDTKINETVVESYLQDTVAWVESTSTTITYAEVAKSNIPDPLTLAMGSGFVRLSQDSQTKISRPSAAFAERKTMLSALAVTEPLNPLTQAAVEAPALPTQAPTEAPALPTQAPTEAPAPPTQAPTEAPAPPTQAPAEAPALPTQAPTEAPALPTLAPTEAPFFPVLTPTEPPAIPTLAPTEAPFFPSLEPTASPVPPAGTATEPPQSAGYVGKIEPTDRTLAVGEGFMVSALCEGVSIQSITWSSSNPAAVAVDGSGKVTAVAVTQQPVLISYTASGMDGAGNAVSGLTASCSVNVSGTKNLRLDRATETVSVGSAITLTAILENGLETDVLSVESSDPNVAAAEIAGRTVTVKGIGAGTANITVKYTENGDTVSAVCTVTVKQDPRENRTSLLKDKDGNELYVQENGNYRQAYYADYYTANKFFKKGETKYTGWQTISGAVKYFDQNGNAVTGEQVIQGVKYNFAGDGTLITGTGTMGIDVSRWNGSIDWNAVKNSGVSYVIIRCGYRGSSQGTLIVDPMFQNNIKGATDAGLKVGVYFFTQAVDRVEAVEEASMVLDLIKNYRISYPVFLDVEPSGGRADGISRETRTEVCTAFCQTIQNANYTAGIYANKTWLTEKIDTGQLSAYKIWLAQYASVPTYTGRYDLWQYKSTGRVSGISGDVDLNLSYLGY